MELLVKIGYGGSRADRDKAIGRSGDGDIDGKSQKRINLVLMLFTLSFFFPK